MWSQGGCIFPVAIQQSRCEYSLCFCLCFPFVWVLFHENGLWRVAVRTINYFVDYDLSGDIWCVNPSPGNTHKILDIVPCPFVVTWQCPCLWPPLAESLLDEWGALLYFVILVFPRCARFVFHCLLLFATSTLLKGALPCFCLHLGRPLTKLLAISTQKYLITKRYS